MTSKSPDVSVTVAYDHSWHMSTPQSANELWRIYPPNYHGGPGVHAKANQNYLLYYLLLEPA